VLHASLVYTPGSAWLIVDPHGNHFFELLHDFLALFRMPCFFMISGLLSILVLERKGVAHFLRSRTIRLIVPCISAFLGLVILEDWLLAQHTGKPFREILSRPYWFSHLWFLVHLLVYCYALALVQRFAAGLPTPPIFGGAIMLVMPFATLAAEYTSVKMLGTDHFLWRGLSMTSFARYAVFFAFGAAYRPGMDDRRDWKLVTWSTAIALAVLAASLAYRNLPFRIVHGCLSWSLGLLCLQVAKRYLDRPIWALKPLGQASYTVYLFHHVFVIGLGMVLLRLPIDPWIKFTSIVIVTFLATMAIHRYIIAPVPVLRFLFNGETTRKPA
jgi:glucan biosynthesis protein C